MTLFYYVIKDYFKYVLGTVILATFLFILFDFIHKTTRYLARYEPNSQHLIQYYIYQTPNLIMQSLPIASLLASVICMVLLSRTNEITAMRAAGMGPLRVGVPIAIGGFILSMVSLGIGEAVLPVSAQKMHYVQEVLIEKNSEVHIGEGAKWIRKENTLFNFGDFDPISRIMTEVKVMDLGPSFRPRKSIEAYKAVYDESKDIWNLTNAKIHYFWPNGTLSYTEHIDIFPLQFPVKPKELQQERRLPNEMSIKELNAIIERGTISGIDTIGYKVDMHVKFAFHFASLVVSLIGLKFGYRSERSLETARGILLALAIGVSYWFILNAGRALGKRGTLPPLLAAWIANAIIFGVSWISILKTRKT